MNEALRFSCLVLYAVGPLVALLPLLRRRFKSPSRVVWTEGWRWYVPTFLLPVEWLLPPVLIALGVGEIQADWLALRVAGFGVALAGVALLAWASLSLGPFLVHEAALIEGHILVTRGPYRFVRHPIYSGYLALLLGSGVATLNAGILLLWPLSLVGILIQAASEERLLQSKFGLDHEQYVACKGLLVPRWGKLLSVSRVASVLLVTGGVIIVLGQSIALVTGQFMRWVDLEEARSVQELAEDIRPGQTDGAGPGVGLAVAAGCLCGFPFLFPTGLAVINVWCMGHPLSGVSSRTWRILARGGWVVWCASVRPHLHDVWVARRNLGRHAVGAAGVLAAGSRVLCVSRGLLCLGPLAAPPPMTTMAAETSGRTVQRG